MKQFEDEISSRILELNTIAIDKTTISIDFPRLARHIELSLDDKEVKIDKKKENNDITFTIMNEIYKKLTTKSLNEKEFKNEVNFEHQGDLSEFIKKNIGETSPTCNILRTITQSCIAPFVVEKKHGLINKIRYKDGQEWKILIKLNKNESTVTHIRTEIAQKIYPDDYSGTPESLFCFSWSFSFVFNSNFDLKKIITSFVDATALEKDKKEENEKALKTYEEEIKTLKQEFEHSQTFPSVKLTFPSLCKLQEKIKIEIESKDLQQLTENSWIGLYEINKPDKEYITFYSTPIGSVLTQEKTTFELTMPNYSGEFCFRFFVKNYQKAVDVHDSTKRIVCGYSLTSAKLNGGWEKGILDDSDPKKLVFEWNINGLQEKNCYAQLINSTEQKYSRNYLEQINIVKLNGEAFFNTPYTEKEAKYEVRVFDPFGYQIGVSQKISIPEEVKKACEEKMEIIKYEVIPKIVVPKNAKFDETIKIEISLEKNNGVFPKDSWIGFYHSNKDNVYEENKYVSFEYIEKLNFEKWTHTKPGKKITIEYKIPKSTGECVIAYFANKKCVSYSNVMTIDELFLIEIFEKSSESIKVMWYQR
jgi:hypothetical protein